MSDFIVCHDHLAWRVVDGEAVIVHHDSSAYYGLNQSGTRIWQLLVNGISDPDAIAKELSATFKDTPETINDDIRSIIDKMIEEQLVALSDGVTKPNSGEMSLSGKDEVQANYTAPHLTRFGELEQLMLSAE